MSNSNAAQDMLAKIKAKNAAQVQTVEVETTSPAVMEEAAKQEAVVAQSALVAEKEVEKTYQVYKSSLASQRIAMPNGKLINITSNKYITAMEDEIEFLDNEIKKGFPYLTKGEPVVSSDLDPMNALRKKFYAEFLAEQTKVPAPALGNTETAPIIPASTNDLGALAGNSNSASAE